MGKGVAHALAAGADEEVRPVAPTLEEASEILAAQLVPLVFFQLGPLPVLVADHWQRAVGEDTVPFILELEAVVDIQIAIETEAFPISPTVFTVSRRNAMQ